MTRLFYLLSLLSFVASYAYPHELSFNRFRENTTKTIDLEQSDMMLSESMNSLLSEQGLADMQERARRLNVLRNVWFYDDDEESRKVVDADGRYRLYGAPQARQDGALWLYGKDYAEVAAPELAGSPLELCERVIAAMPEEKRKVYQEAYNALYASGDDRKADWYALYGRMVRDGVRAEYESAASIRIEDWEKDKQQYSHLIVRLIESKHARTRKANMEALALQKEIERKRAEQAKLEKNELTKKTIIISSLSIVGIFLIFTISHLAKKHSAKLKTLHPFTIAAVALLLVALFEMPHAYYTFLRVAICAYSIYALVTFWRRDSPNLRPLLAVAIAILYNPAFPIALHYRSHWLIANIATIILTLAFLRIHIRKD